MTLNPFAARAASASSRPLPVIVRTMRTARSRSLPLLAFTSTMRLPYVLPSRTITIVENMLSTSFCAVPALSRVEPLITSGPTSTSIACSAAALSGVPVLHDSPTVSAPSARARRTAASTYGVRPLEATPTTVSSGPIPAASTSAAPASSSSSAPSQGETIALRPPAMIAKTCSGGVEKVGGHSEASSTPSRPGVPAPT